MAIITQQLPKIYNQAGQTIPFVVISDVFELIQDFDIIQNSFKYVFEVKTLRDDGAYKTFARVAINPRPDNFVGYFDASAIVRSAITYTNYTHKNTTATIDDKAIVQFMVICFERYLDNNGEYVSNTPNVLGTFFAINSQVENPIEDYLIYATTGNTKPLHQHDFLGRELSVREKEAFTLSYSALPQISGNLLEFEHGDYGFFDFGTVTQYTKLNINSTFVESTRFISGSFSQGDGRALQLDLKSDAFLDTDPGGTLLTLQNVLLEGGKNYVAGGFIRISQPVPFSTPDNSPLIFIQVKISGVTTILNFPIPLNLTKTQFLPFSLSFSVASTNNYNIEIEIVRDPAALIGLDIYNSRRFFFDNLGVFELFDDNKTIEDIDIVVNEGLPNEITHTLDASYFTDIVNLNTIGSGRFDLPLNGVLISNDTNVQDPTTTLFKDSTGAIGKYYNVLVIGDSITNKSERIYQNEEKCGQYDSYRLKWLNKMGAWDYYTFDKVTTAVTNYDRDTYKKEIGEFIEIEDNVINYRDVNDVGYTSLMVNEIDNITFNTDWLTKKQIQWFADLLSSRRVFLLNSDKLRLNPTSTEEDEYPIIINNAQYTYTTNNKNQKLTSLTLNCTLARKFNEKTTNIID